MGPTWLDSDWDYRLPITILCQGESASTAVRVEVDLSQLADLDHLWTVLNLHGTPGNDIRVTLSDGRTLAVYDLQSFNATTRTGTLRFDYTTPNTTSAVGCGWLYFGNTAASAGAGTTVNTTAVTGKIAQEDPAGYPVLGAYAQETRSSETRELLPKTPGETIFVGYEIPDLTPRCEPSAKFKGYEGIDYVKQDVWDNESTPAIQESMKDLDEVRFVQCEGGPLVVRVAVLAGTVDKDYGSLLTVETTLGRTLQRRIGVAVRTTTET